MWRRVGRDSLILVGSQLGLVVFQLAYRGLAIHDVSVSNYGRVGLLLAIFNGVTVIGAYGVPTSTARLDGPADARAPPRRILGFSAWLSVANFGVLALVLLPRVSLAHFSYKEVAYFDLALLIYTIPQRMKASFLVALVPIAAVQQLKRAP